MSLVEPTTQRGREWLRNVKAGQSHDNTSIVKRPGAKEILGPVLTEVRVQYRTSHMPTPIGTIDEQELAKVMYPRSIFKASKFEAAVDKFLLVADTPVPYFQNILEEYKDDVCWQPSAMHEWQPDLKRNIRARKKAAGFPNGGKKADALPGAIQYNEQVVKPANSIAVCYADIAGYRTQQSDPNDPKIRLVFAKPCHVWQMEGECLDDSISKTIEISQSLKKRFQVMYFDARTQLSEWMSQFPNVTCWVYIDATAFDTDVMREEISACYDYLAPQYPWKDLLAQHTACAKIVMPKNIVVRNGGMSSGGKITNVGDGICNFVDHLNALQRLRLERYLECVIINGDDITFGFSTRINKANLDKWANLSLRDISAEKSIKFDDALVNSKWICGYHKDGSTYNTRSIFRAINSLAFKERESSALTANAVYVAIARHQILLDVEEHPLFEVLARELAKYEEYTLSQAMDDPRWSETLEYYIGTHDYVGDLEADEFVNQLQSSRYAAEFT